MTAMSKLELLANTIINWYAERNSASAHECDDLVSDLDEYIIEDLMSFCRGLTATELEDLADD